MRRQTQHQSQWQIERSEENCSSSPSQILERVQPDRVTLTKPEEDRRRRTIIVEKKNGSYGFTLQSYGIHYKKEQEIEMITYVDYVDYDGPAYRSGMREGDVILSINGSDMEKSDHKTLVNFIKGCDTRMRMVVLFEDCVRKVELHIRYIQLQRILQNKMAELEKLCIRERQLMEGKWKTHSLPARKKAHQALNGDPPTPSQTAYSYCRPTVSTEDVAKAQHRQQNPPLILAYRYLDPHYRYMLQPSSSSSGEYLLTIDSSRQQNVIVKGHSDKTKHNKANQTSHDGNMEKVKKEPSSSSSTYHSYTGNLCNPCLQVTSNGDNTSLEAYDLASPCCDPHCVPTRRRSKHPKDHHRRKDSKSEETQTEPHQQQKQIRSRPHSQASQTPPANHPYTGPRRYFHFGAGLVSQCSLHSCTSSELSAVAPTTIGESSPSYTTSLSTDTLYWNGSCDTSSRQLSIKSANKHDYQQRYSQHHPQDTAIYVQYNTAKPKSWDNLATKAFGGYGFGGYGYIDTSVKCPGKPGSSRSNSTSSTKAQGTQYVRFDKQTANSSSGGPQPQYTPHTHRRYFPENKSTESLLSIPKYSNEALSDSSLSCECLESALPVPDTAEDRFFQSPRQSVVSPTDPNFGYYSARKAPRNEYPKNVSTSSEATRL